MFVPRSVSVTTSGWRTPLVHTLGRERPTVVRDWQRKGGRERGRERDWEIEGGMERRWRDWEYLLVHVNTTLYPVGISYHKIAQLLPDWSVFYVVLVALIAVLVLVFLVWLCCCCCLRRYSGILWYTVVYCDILWYTVIYCGILWYALIYRYFGY